MIRAAGVLFLSGSATSGTVLLLKRSGEGDAAGQWAFPGGKIEDDETAEQAARRECTEEMGEHPTGPLALHMRSQWDAVDYTTFVQRVEKTFHPTLNEEHEGFAWASRDALPDPIHPGARLAIDKLTMDELEIARSMAAGKMTSPQRYMNVTLFDVRITGTDTAYRRALDEHVYRPPAQYLGPEFLARCAGLPVVVMHPPKKTLDSQEFQDRIVGTVFLPYVKGDEVWGIAKIYDDGAAKMMTDHRMSTSPAVVFRDMKETTRTVDMEDGSTLLVEGKPALLDHLAICEVGVWDKGGEPTGVSSVTTIGDPPMTDEEKKALEEKLGKAEKGRADAQTRADALEATAKEERASRERADAEAGVQLDKLLECVDALGKRMDALEAPPEQGGGNESGETEEKELEAEEKKDVKEAKADAAAARKDAQDLRAEIEVLRGTIPKHVTDADYTALADAQATYDQVYQAFGDAAPRPLQGETLVAYRRRLATGVQKHSATWKGVDLGPLPEGALVVAESQIRADALARARVPDDLPEGTLRGIVTTDVTGRRSTSFVGEPRSWMNQFSAHRRRLSGIRNASR